MVSKKLTVPAGFSFIVTCYNFEKYLSECLESLTRQNYNVQDYEIVCVDDGSTDDSWAMIEKYRRQYPNFSGIHVENSGVEKACNLALRRSRFKWVVRVDSDDTVDANFLSVMSDAMKKRPGFDFYYCKDYFEYYSKAERKPRSLPDFDVEEIFSRGDFFATGTVYQKSDLEAVGLFPEEVKNCGLENYSVILALLTKNKKGLAVPGTWFNYRRHGNNMSVLKREAIVEFGRKLLASYGRPFTTNPYHPYGLKLETENKRP